MSEDTFRQRVVVVVVVLLFTAHKYGRNISFLCFLSARGRAYRMCVFIWQTTFHFKLLEGSNCGGCLALIAPHKKLNRCCRPGAGEDEHWKPKSQQSEEAQDPSQIERQITPIGWVCWCTKGGWWWGMSMSIDRPTTLFISRRQSQRATWPQQSKQMLEMPAKASWNLYMVSISSRSSGRDDFTSASDNSDEFMEGEAAQAPHGMQHSF